MKQSDYQDFLNQLPTTSEEGLRSAYIFLKYATSNGITIGNDEAPGDKAKALDAITKELVKRNYSADDFQAVDTAAKVYSLQKQATASRSVYENLRDARLKKNVELSKTLITGGWVAALFAAYPVLNKKPAKVILMYAAIGFAIGAVGAHIYQSRKLGSTATGKVSI